MNPATSYTHDLLSTISIRPIFAFQALQGFLTVIGVQLRQLHMQLNVAWERRTTSIVTHPCLSIPDFVSLLLSHVFSAGANWYWTTTTYLPMSGACRCMCSLLQTLFSTNKFTLNCQHSSEHIMHVVIPHPVMLQPLPASAVLPVVQHLVIDLVVSDCLWFATQHMADVKSFALYVNTFRLCSINFGMNTLQIGRAHV